MVDLRKKIWWKSRVRWTDNSIRLDILNNPVVVFEVLSPSTEARDRGVKFKQKCTTPSLREYVLVSQDRRDIDRYTRHPGGWLLTTFHDASLEFEFSSIDVTLKMEEVYQHLVFSDPADGEID